MVRLKHAFTHDIFCKDSGYGLAPYPLSTPPFSLYFLCRLGQPLLVGLVVEQRT